MEQAGIILQAYKGERPSIGKAPNDPLATVPAFSGIISWPNELLEGNMHVEDTKVNAELVEVLSFARRSLEELQR